MKYELKTIKGRSIFWQHQKDDIYENGKIAHKLSGTQNIRFQHQESKGQVKASLIFDHKLRIDCAEKVGSQEAKDYFMFVTQLVANLEISTDFGRLEGPSVIIMPSSKDFKTGIIIAVISITVVGLFAILRLVFEGLSSDVWVYGGMSAALAAWMLYLSRKGRLGNRLDFGPGSELIKAVAAEHTGVSYVFTQI